LHQVCVSARPIRGGHQFVRETIDLIATPLRLPRIVVHNDESAGSTGLSDLVSLQGMVHE